VAAQLGHLDEALAASTAALDALTDGATPEWFTPAALAWICHGVFTQAGRTAQALQVVQWGARWLRETAWPQVPPAFQSAFAERQPLHRALLAAAVTPG